MTSAKLVKQFGDIYNLTKSKGHPCIQRLIGKKCSDDMECAPPDAYHMILWNKFGKPYSYMSQQYVLGLEMMRKVIQFCDKYNLNVQVDAYPSHNDGHPVVTLTYKKKGK